MGDKIRAKEAMRAAGVLCVPGSEGALPMDADACAAVAGRSAIPSSSRPPAAVAGAACAWCGAGGARRGDRHDARGSGVCIRQSDLYIEKFLEHPRHIEIQVLCDHTATRCGSASATVPCSAVIRRSSRRRRRRVFLPRNRSSWRALRGRLPGHRLSRRRTFEFLYEDGVFASSR